MSCPEPEIWISDHVSNPYSNINVSRDAKIRYSMDCYSDTQLYLYVRCLDCGKVLVKHRGGNSLKATTLCGDSLLFLFCFSGRIPRLSLIWHSLYVGVVENLLPTTHRGAVRTDGAEIPWGWSLPECFASSGRSSTSPFIFNNSVERAAPLNVVSYRRCSELRN